MSGSGRTWITKRAVKSRNEGVRMCQTRAAAAGLLDDDCPCSVEEPRRTGNERASSIPSYKPFQRHDNKPFSRSFAPHSITSRATHVKLAKIVHCCPYLVVCRELSSQFRSPMEDTRQVREGRVQGPPLLVLQPTTHSIINKKCHIPLLPGFR